MKNILFIGQFTELYQEFKTQFEKNLEVTACVNKAEICCKMLKIKKPDAIFILIEEANEDNLLVLNELQDRFTNVPAFCHEKTSGNDYTKKFANSKRYTFIPSLFQTKDVFIQLCKEIGEAVEEDLSTEEVNTSHTETPQTAAKTILIVDDSGIYLRMTKRLLEAENYNVLTTSSGTHALTLAKEQHPDLILLDYEMPLFNGKQTMQKIRESEELNQIPIIFVTAVNDMQHIKEVLTLKPAGYILKPIDKNRLLQTIRSVIGS